MAKTRISSRRPTQFDVALRAGVSQTTVSNILNRTADDAIPEETREKVLNAMQEIGYSPHRAARSLRTNKSYTIAAIIPDITNPFYPLLVRGIQDVTKTHDYDLIIYNTDGLVEEEKNCLRSVIENRVDGVIIVPFHVTEKVLHENNIPVVQLVQKPKSPPQVDSIYIDNVAAAYAVVHHLIDRGHKRIGMIAGEEDTPPHGNRVLGYQKALAEHHLPLDQILIRSGNYTESGGYQAMQELLRMPEPVTAVFAINDLVAMGALTAIREAGLRVPSDISVAGFDDIPAAKLVYPSLTTITQYQDKIGQRAAEILFERLISEAPTEIKSIEMPFSLIVRESA